MTGWPSGTIACRVNEGRGSSEGGDLDVLYMPIDLKQQFCLDLLESIGAEKISVRENRNEIIHCCVAPWHNETKPSAALNFDKMVYRCLAKGGILWLIGITQGVYGPEARNWLSEQTGLGGQEFQLAPLLQFLDALDAAKAKSKTATPMVRYSDAVLQPWDFIYPGLTTGMPEVGIEGRGIPEENLRQARVGWDMADNRIIIPHFWEGDLVGWQGRRILDTTPEKYKSTPDFPRDNTIYCKPQGKRIVVVESPMSVLRHLHHLPIGATFGAAVTEKQINILKWYSEVIFWVDNDPAGWATIEGHWDEKGDHQPGAAQILEGYSNVRAVTHDWAKDPAEFDDEEAEALVEAAGPVSIWQRPTALRCPRCTNYHGGPCA